MKPKKAPQLYMVQGFTFKIWQWLQETKCPAKNWKRAYIPETELIGLRQELKSSNMKNKAQSEPLKLAELHFSVGL